MAFLTVVTHQPLFLFVGAHPPNSADSWAEGMQGPNARWFLIQHYETPLRFLGVETMKKVTFFHPKHWGVLDICHISCPYVSHLKGFKRITFFGLTCFFYQPSLGDEHTEGTFHTLSFVKQRSKKISGTQNSARLFFGGGRWMNPSWHHILQLGKFNVQPPGYWRRNGWKSMIFTNSVSKVPCRKFPWLGRNASLKNWQPFFCPLKKRPNSSQKEAGSCPKGELLVWGSVRWWFQWIICLFFVTPANLGQKDSQIDDIREAKHQFVVVLEWKECRFTRPFQ